MNQMQEAIEEKLGSILFAHSKEKLAEVMARKSRFVHYTSAQVATSILQNNEVWMRNSTTMNDFGEVEYGLQRLVNFYQSPSGKKFKDALNSVFPGATDNFQKQFDSLQPSLRDHTFLTCFSEHLDEEDEYGRLSMWRAYGGANGIALVVRPEVFALKSNALNIYSSPVLYADQNEFDLRFSEIARNIEMEAAFLRQVGEKVFLDLIFHMCRFAVLCTKHPGFKEEREWRVIYSLNDVATKLRREVQVVRGTPQIIYKLPFKDYPDEGLVGLEIPQLLERIIIGPTEHPLATYYAFVELLKTANVENAAAKVFTSAIPLRYC